MPSCRKSVTEYPKALPPEWESSLTNLTELSEELFGSQMDGGWFAQHITFGPVFIKKFTAVEMDDAKAEIALFERLGEEEHPNVAHNLLHQEHNGSMILMQEKLAGGDLLKHIMRAHSKEGASEPYSEEQIRRLFVWMAKGTQFLHSHGIAHRDLKPENVMGGGQKGSCSGQRGYIKLVDFGCANWYQTVAEAAGSDQALRALQDHVHTPTATDGYSSPECVLAFHNYGVDQTIQPYNPFANDVHCLAAILYTLGTGLPFPNRTAADMTVVDERLGAAGHLSDSCRQVIRLAAAAETERVTVNQLLLHAWVTSNDCSEEPLPDCVMDGLLKLSDTTTVKGKIGDWLVHEVGTDGTHLIEANEFSNIYDTNSAVAIADLSLSQKENLRKWRDAEALQMRLFTPLLVRQLVVVTEATMAALCSHWSELTRSVSYSNGDVCVTNAAAIPTNRQVFDFVHGQVEGGKAAFCVTQHQKKGVFGRALSEADCGEDIVLRRCKSRVPWFKSEQLKQPTMFVYKAHWNNGAQFIKLQIGDAFMYQTLLGKLHTIEQEAFERNYQPYTPPAAGPPETTAADRAGAARARFLNHSSVAEEEEQCSCVIA